MCVFYEKAPVHKLSHSKAPKKQQICHNRHTRKTSGLFLLYDTGVDFSSRNGNKLLFNFLAITNIREKICQVSNPVQSIILWHVLVTVESRRVIHSLRIASYRGFTCRKARISFYFMQCSDCDRTEV